LKASLGNNAMESSRSLYDYVVYDSTNEKNFATELEKHTDEVEVYVKLPRGFYINTPVGHYNPDWAIAFYEDKVKHIYFVAETKGNMSSMELRDIEKAKKACAKKHFETLSREIEDGAGGKGKVVYDIVDSYEKLWEIVGE
jgi:type III restriction enzyme